MKATLSWQDILKFVFLTKCLDWSIQTTRGPAQPTYNRFPLLHSLPRYEETLRLMFVFRTYLTTGPFPNQVFAPGHAGSIERIFRNALRLVWFEQMLRIIIIGFWYYAASVSVWSNISWATLPCRLPHEATKGPCNHLVEKRSKKVKTQPPAFAVLQLPFDYQEAPSL